MRIGILADIHEHRAHLDAALSRLSRRGVDRLVVLGDVLETGRHAVEIIARLEAVGAVGVWGNHDIGYARPIDPATIADVPLAVRSYLGRLADRFEIDGVLFSHVEPWRDPYDVVESYYIDGPPESAERAQRTFEAIPQRAAIIGHFHRWLALDEQGTVSWDVPNPLVMKSGSRYLVAVGAVSDGWCAWLDTASGVLEPLDIRERPRQAFLPPANPAHAMAASWLDRIRDRPEGDEAGREALLQELVSRVPAAGIREALRGRMREVGRSHGGILLQLLESLGDAPLLDELAAAVESEPGLPADRAWEVLSLLEATGLLEDRPILAEMHAELAELLDEGEASLGELAAQIEDEPDGVVLALEGLEEVEPEVRAAILEGLASQPVGPGLVEFLRLLAAHPEPLTKAAAREVLETLAATDARAALAWRWVAEEGGGPHRQLEQTPNPERREVIPVGASGSVAHAVVVGDVDGDGRATLGFVSRDGEGWTAAVFTCDVNDGVVAVSGLYTEDRADAMAVLGTIAGVSSEGRPAVGVLGRELLAGCLWLSGALSPTALRYWVERAVDAHLRPGPLPAPSFEPSPGSLEELRRDAEAVLVALPLWRDTSKLAEDLAREVHERAGRSGPIDDPAVRRLLFERRVRDRIPVLQRMLIWQALLWQAAGAEALSQSARRLAASLLGPEQVLPTHPFLDAYLRRSLEYGNGSSTSSDPHTPRRLANGS